MRKIRVRIEPAEQASRQAFFIRQGMEVLDPRGKPLEIEAEGVELGDAHPLVIQMGMVREWMKKALAEKSGDFIGAGAEVDATKLAEESADWFGLYGDDEDATIPEWVFDLAAEVAFEHEESSGNE